MWGLFARQALWKWRKTEHLRWLYLLVTCQQLKYVSTHLFVHLLWALTDTSAQQKLTSPDQQSKPQKHRVHDWSVHVLPNKWSVNSSAAADDIVHAANSHILTWMIPVRYKVAIWDDPNPNPVLQQCKKKKKRLPVVCQSEWLFSCRDFEETTSNFSHLLSSSVEKQRKNSLRLLKRN